MSRRPPRTRRRCAGVDEQLLRDLATEVRALRRQLAAPPVGTAAVPSQRLVETDPSDPSGAPSAVQVDMAERRAAAYARLRERIATSVDRLVPADGVVLVVSRGDDALLELPGRVGRHFPATTDGVWAGHHPADSADAVAALGRARAEGAGYLVVPATSSWWFAHYAGFRAHLERTGRLLLRDDACVLLALEPATPNVPSPIRPALERS